MGLADLTLWILFPIYFSILTYCMVYFIRSYATGTITDRESKIILHMYMVSSLAIVFSICAISTGFYGWHLLFLIGMGLYLLMVLLINIEIKNRSIQGHSLLLLGALMIFDTIDYLLHGEIPVDMRYRHFLLALLVILIAMIPLEIRVILREYKKNPHSFCYSSNENRKCPKID